MKFLIFNDILVGLYCVRICQITLEVILIPYWVTNYQHNDYYMEIGT